ncbi:hypothetical protein T11_11974 [Trichinella zimbabwensis]|uniref:Uncharacterized protein n=1 Tax=Trichinella zimbabwensis TaxID=268475 RepID=A0A0V1I8J1_9BILA|nr:hypothetical protein T11_11974 [Trichinella zimbabwensis]
MDMKLEITSSFNNKNELSFLKYLMLINDRLLSKKQCKKTRSQELLQKLKAPKLFFFLIKNFRLKCIYNKKTKDELFICWCLQLCFCDFRLGVMGDPKLKATIPVTYYHG